MTVRKPRDQFEAQIMRSYIEHGIHWRDLDFDFSSVDNPTSGVWRFRVVPALPATGVNLDTIFQRPQATGTVWIDDANEYGEPLDTPRVMWRIGSEENDGNFPPVLALLPERG